MVDAARPELCLVVRCSGARGDQLLRKGSQARARAHLPEPCARSLGSAGAFGAGSGVAGGLVDSARSSRKVGAWHLMPVAVKAWSMEVIGWWTRSRLPAATTSVTVATIGGSGRGRLPR